MCSALHSVCVHTHTHTHINTQFLGNLYLMRKKHTCVYADRKVVVQPFCFSFWFSALTMERENNEPTLWQDGREESSLVRMREGFLQTVLDGLLGDPVCPSPLCSLTPTCVLPLAEEALEFALTPGRSSWEPSYHANLSYSFPEPPARCPSCLVLGPLPIVSACDCIFPSSWLWVELRQAFCLKMLLEYLLLTWLQTSIALLSPGL